MHSQNGGIMLYESNKKGEGGHKEIGDVWGGIQFVPFFHNIYKD